MYLSSARQQKYEIFKLQYFYILFTDTGFAVIERLERIVTFGGISADDVEVFNKQGQVIAVLRCIFMFEEIIDVDIIDGVIDSTLELQCAEKKVTEK